MRMKMLSAWLVTAALGLVAIFSEPVLASMVTSKAAICGHFKTGHLTGSV